MRREEIRNMKKDLKITNVDSYLESVPPDKRVLLERLRKTIKSAAPKAEEVISYRMPAYKYHGVLVYFAAFKDHCSFFPGAKSILKTFASELKGYRTSAGTIQFTVENPLPVSLVRKIVEVRVAENESRRKK